MWVNCCTSKGLEIVVNHFICCHFSAAPKLHEITPDMLDSFTSRSAPVIARAQQCHNEEMRKLKLPWWKKLWDEEDVDETRARENQVEQDNEQLNF